MFVYGRFGNKKDALVAANSLLDADFRLNAIDAMTRVGDDVRSVHPVQRIPVKIGIPIGITAGIIGGLLLVPLFNSPATTGELVRGGLIGAIIGLAVGVLGPLGFWRVDLQLPARRASEPIFVGVNTMSRQHAARAALRHSDALDVGTCRSEDEARSIVRLGHR